MKVRFLKPAQSEIDDAFVWYETQSHGLGTQFLDEFDRAISGSLGQFLKLCVVSGLENPGHKGKVLYER